jgi:predicted Zn finger-like uncharacterized protein
MKVVCDNCQAVYKIADHKLVKEINRATCKRCGHKIIIFQHNPASARSTLKESVSPLSDSGAASASSEDIERLAQMTNGGLPSLGSLTKELRAISAPPMAPKAASASIGPAAGAITTDPGPPVPPAGAPTLPLGARIPGLNAPPPDGSPVGKPVAAPRNGSSGAAIAPIPASDSPDTRVYRGPSPTGPVLSAVASQSAEPFGLDSKSTGAAAVSETESTRPMTYPQPPLPVPPGAPSSAGVAGYSSPVISAAVSNTSVTQIEHQGSPLLGTAGVLGAASFMGLLLIILVPGPLSVLGFALAGFGAAGTMALALITEKGRWPSKVPLAMFVGALMGLGSGALALGIQSLDSAPTTTVQAVTQPPPAPASAVAAQPAAVPADAEAADGSAAADAEPAEEPPAEVAAPVSPAAAARSAAPTPRRSSRASTRRSGPPQLPGLSAAERAELQSYASQKGSIGSSSPTRSSRSERSSGGSRDRGYRASDKIAKSGSQSSYSGSAASSRKDKRVSAAAPTGPRGTPQSSRGRSGSKSSGSAPNQFIIKTIIGSNKSIKRCISSQRSRDPDLSGKLYVKFKISPSGSVTRARVTTSRYAGTALDTCISREVNALQFPPFEGKVQNITYPLLVIGD